jgi:hypothetical protein
MPFLQERYRYLSSETCSEKQKVPPMHACSLNCSTGQRQSSSSGGWLQDHLTAHAFQPRDQLSLGPLMIQLIKVVDSFLFVRLPDGEEVIHGDQDTVTHRDRSALASPDNCWSDASLAPLALTPLWPPIPFADRAFELLTPFHDCRDKIPTQEAAWAASGKWLMSVPSSASTMRDAAECHSGHLIDPCDLLVKRA